MPDPSIADRVYRKSATTVQSDGPSLIGSSPAAPRSPGAPDVTAQRVAECDITPPRRTRAGDPGDVEGDVLDGIDRYRIAVVRWVRAFDAWLADGTEDPSPAQLRALNAAMSEAADREDAIRERIALASEGLAS